MTTTPKPKTEFEASLQSLDLLAQCRDNLVEIRDLLSDDPTETRTTVADFVAGLIYAGDYSGEAQYEAIREVQREVAIQVAEAICERIDQFEGNVAGWTMKTLELVLIGKEGAL